MNKGALQREYIYTDVNNSFSTRKRTCFSIMATRDRACYSFNGKHTPRFSLPFLFSHSFLQILQNPFLSTPVCILAYGLDRGFLRFLCSASSDCKTEYPSLDKFRFSAMPAACRSHSCSKMYLYSQDIGAAHFRLSFHDAKI